MSVAVAARWVFALTSSLALAGCVTSRRLRPPPAGQSPWDARRIELVQARTWEMDGRAAVAFRDQGWQASITWQQQDKNSQVNLAGPLGIGAVTLKLGPDGLTIVGGPKSGAKGAAALAELQDRLGFELPLEHLRYWVLGVADPAMDAHSTPNEQDRLQQLIQDGWTVDYDRYVTVAADVLPGKLVLSRDTVRVRMSVDHWNLLP